MRDYFADFEFISFKRRIWMPLFYKAMNEAHAKRIATAFARALDDTYELKRASTPALVVEGLNKPMLKKYCKAFEKGRPTSVTVHEWTVKAGLPQATMTYSEIMKDGNTDAGRMLAALANGAKIRHFAAYVVNEDAGAPKVEDLLYFNVVTDFVPGNG